MPTERQDAERQRVLLPAFDSVAQRQLYDLHPLDPAKAEEALVGDLRAAHFLGGRILLSDAMLLDSRFFNEIGPEKLANRLGISPTDLPLTILCAEPDLKTTLTKKLDDAGFRWQLGHGNSGRSWVTPEITARWNEWIDAAAAGRIQIEQMSAHADGSAKPDFPFELDLAKEAGLNHPVVATFVEASRGTLKRSTVYTAYDQALSSTSDEEIRNELRILREIWNEHYLQAQAIQQDASWLALPPRGGEETDGQPQPRVAKVSAGRRSFKVSGDLLESLRTMPPGVYAQLLYATSRQRAAFAANPSTLRMRSLAFMAAAAKPAGGGLLVSAATALSSLALAVVLYLISQQFVVLHGWWALFAAVVTALATFPWSKLMPLRQLWPRTLDGALSVAK